MLILTPLEKQAIHMLLDGKHVVLSILRQQAEGAIISSRELTGVGFFTRFAIPDHLQRIPNSPKFQLGDVVGEASNIKHGFGFVLFIEAGMISMLEAFTYDQPWPSTIENWKLTYLEPGGDRSEVITLLNNLVKK